MGIDKLSSLFSRLFFAVAVVLLAAAVAEKIANVNEYTLTRVYDPQRLLELAATMMVFVIALLLRQIRQAVRGAAR